MRVTILLLSLLLAAASALAETYLILPGQEENLVTFVSKAPLETVEGKTAQVSGIVVADLADLAAGVDVTVSVDLASIKTGIDKRDRHMCENHLETDEFPHAVFHATQVSGAPAEGIPVGGSGKFALTGDFSLHGVTKAITVPIELSRFADRIEVSGQFQVELAEYEIKRPKFLVLKLDETQKITLTLTARSEG